MSLKPRDGEVSMRATGRIVELAEALTEAREACKRIDSLKAELLDLLGDCDSAFHGPRIVVRRTLRVQRRFSQSAFKSDHPDLYEHYMAEQAYMKVDT